MNITRREFINQTGIYNIGDLQSHYERKTKGHWFSKGAKAFFNSRISSELYYRPELNQVLFISSEKFDYKSPRKYTLRSYDVETGVIDTVGEFQQFKTLSGVKRNASRLTGV